jgi:nucleoside-diphosphate-sugar epimerase
MNLNDRRILVTGGSGFIGTAVVARLLAAGYTVCNFDLKPPYLPEHAPYWRAGDLLDRDTLQAAFDDAAPSAVVHLAARTDTLSRKLDDYRVNTEGSANVVDACHARPAIRRLVFTSSQFVFGPYGLPGDDEDFRPHTAYGESKAIAERYLRTSHPGLCWTIVRPTNIWGPWHPRYPREFWRVLRRGLYLHPRGPEVIRSYGYVGTVADQINTILDLPEALVNQRVLYLGDSPMRLVDWANGFSLALTGRRVREVPFSILRLIALAGDALQTVTGRAAPLTTSRLRSMTESYPTPMEPTFLLLGTPKRTLEEGIAETVRWLVETQPQFHST